MRHPSRFTLTIAAFALALSLAVPAFAAPAAWERVDVTRHSDPNGGVLLVSGELPASASLPAEAELSVPAGSELQWIGEILGGASADDPDLKYTKVTKDGSDYYRFTLTKARTAQIEVPIAEKQAFDGTNYTSSVAWTATQDVPEVRLSLRVPATAQVVTPTEGAALLPGDGGYGFYSKTVQNVKAGDKLDLAVVYAVPATAANTAARTPAGSNSAVPILLVLLVVAAFAGLVFAVRRKMSGGSGVYEDDSASDDEVAADNASSTYVDEAVEADVEDTPGERAPMSARTKRNLVTGGIAVVLILAAVVVGMQTTTPKATGDTISQTFSSAEPCVKANIALVVDPGADPSKTAETLFAAITPIPSLTTATYNKKTSSLEIGFCESQTSEAALRQALTPTGLVAPGGAVAPAPAPAPAAAP